MDTETEAVLTQPYKEISYKMNLLLKTGELLVRSGADTSRITRNMLRAASYMGIPKNRIHYHITYTTLMLNINDDTHSYTEFRKCQYHGVNLAAIMAISKMIWRAMEENYPLDRYEKELLKIQHQPSPYPLIMRAAGASFACGGFSMLFGADWIAFFATAIASFIGFFVRELCRHYAFHTYATTAITAFAASMVAWSTQFAFPSSTPLYPMMSCSLFLIPGIPMINAIDDMLNNFINGGIIRLVNALLIISCMTFGIVLALWIGNVHDFTTLPILPDSLYASQALAALIGSVGYSVIFNVPKRLLWVTGVGGIIVVDLKNLLVIEAGMYSASATFIACAFLGIITMRAVHWFHAPSVVLNIPSIIPMVPGVLFYRLLFAILNIQAITGSELLNGLRSGFAGTTIILAMAIGVTVPSLFIRTYIQRDELLHIKNILERRYQ